LPLICTLAVVTAATLFIYRRSRHGSSVALPEVPDTSVPEALHTLGHGTRAKRALAARALVEILGGEVQVLEDVLDEAQGAHPDVGGGRGNDGRGVLGVVLDELAGLDPQGPPPQGETGQRGGEGEALVDLLLQCTAYDSQWDESDEWNQLTLRAVSFLCEEERAEVRLSLARDRYRGSLVAQKAAVVQRRLAGERAAAAEVNSLSPAPGMLSMNTRFACPVCMRMRADLVRCPQCRSVGYCSEEHMRSDADRHRAWCFAASS